MAEPFMSEIRMMSFNFAPKGWATCDGQMLAINQNQALFSLLGTTYGGNGINTFALPDLKGRMPLHFSTNYPLGQKAGAETHTLTISQLPVHTHAANANSAPATQSSPSNNYWAKGTKTEYAAAANLAVMSGATLSTAGANQPHLNLAPLLVLNFCIALQGIFPSQS
jgi:microcystin-dependent protein